MFRGWRWNGGKEEGGLVGGEAVKAEKSRGEGMEVEGADSKQKRILHPSAGLGPRRRVESLFVPWHP